MVSQGCPNEMPVYRLHNSGPVQAERDISFDRRSPSVGLPLILYGVALEVLLLLTGVVVVAVQTFFADKVSFWSIILLCSLSIGISIFNSNLLVNNISCRQ